MPQFIFKLCLLLPLLAGMAWVNWSFDPAILMVEHRDDPMRHPYENIIAEDLLAGRSHRLKSLQLELVVDELVFRGRPQIDTLVFGTSIAKPIHAGLFGGPNFFNASVTGGRIEEMIMADQLALDCGLKPRHVLIEIDARSLNPRDGVPDSKLLRRALRRLNLPVASKRDSVLQLLWRAVAPGEETAGAAKVSSPFYPYDELLSPRYFQFTMAFLARRWMARGDKPRELVSQFGESNESLLYPDGSLQWWDNALGANTRKHSADIRTVAAERPCRSRRNGPSRINPGCTKRLSGISCVRESTCSFCSCRRTPGYSSRLDGRQLPPGGNCPQSKPKGTFAR